MGTNALFFFFCTGRFNKILPVVVFRRSLSSPSDRSACVAWLQHAGQWGLQHASSHIRTRNLEEHGFILGCECFFFVLSCDANFVSWENFFPEESEWFCRNQAQAFAQDVCLSTMLLHSSFSTGKIPWKEVSVRNLSFEKIPTEIFVRRKNSCWEACWQEHCCWAVCFVLSGKDVFRETTGRKGSLAAKFPARIPCTKIQIHSFHDNLVFEADMRLKEIGLERIRWQAVSATIFLCIPASWLQEISNFVLRKCCNVTFLEGIFFTSKVLYNRSSFPGFSVLKLLEQEICFATSCLLTEFLSNLNRENLCLDYCCNLQQASV